MADVIFQGAETGRSETSERPTQDNREPRRHRARIDLSLDKKLIFATFTTLSVTLILAIAGELFLRFRHGRLTDFGNVGPDVASAISMLPTAYDPELGYIPRPGASNFGPDRVNVDDEGLRKNGNLVTPPGPPILAVGDSFTWGSQVGDDQTWPAYLQAMFARRVLNAGVNGYGVDQIVMRAERLVPSHRPGGHNQSPVHLGVGSNCGIPTRRGPHSRIKRLATSRICRVPHIDPFF